jgi:hypothetical protein
MTSARRGLWFALPAALALHASGPIAYGQVAGGGCGYEVIETLPDGPNCGFGPYVANILDINDAGTVCGYLTAGFCPNLAFMQEPGGPLVILPVPAGSLGSRANAMNELGVLVGNFRGSDDQLKPCKWVNGVCIPLPMLRNANFGDATAINETNLIVGYCTNTTSGPGHACMWEGRRVLDIHTGDPWEDSRADDINDLLEVTGTLYQDTVDDQRAFVWSHAGALTILPAIPGGINSLGVAINNSGTVIGHGFTGRLGQPGTVRRSFIWRDGVMRNLGIFRGATSISAESINDDDRIAGKGSPGGRMFLWDMGVIQTVEVNGVAIEGLSPTVNNTGLIGDKGQRLRVLPRNVADINRNCAVNTDDLLEVITNWGAAVSPADVNLDGIVDALDLQVVLDAWG